MVERRGEGLDKPIFFIFPAMASTAAARLTGKVALVTGAGSGIGRASALALGREGASLVLVGRRQAPLEETAGALKALDPAAAPLVQPTDCTDPAAVSALFRAVEERHGRLDVLFNNAGSGAPPQRSLTPTSERLARGA